MVQGHAARREVAASLPRVEVDLVVALQSFDGLRLDQRDFMPAAVVQVRRPVAAGVAVALNALAENDADFFLQLHGRLAPRAGVDGEDGSLPHGEL